MLKEIYCLFKNSKEAPCGLLDFAETIRGCCGLELYSFYGSQCDEAVRRLTDLQKSTERGFLVIADSLSLFPRAAMPFPIIGFGSWGNLNCKYILESFEDLDSDYPITVYNRYYGLPCEILKTDRLCVRELTSGDMDALYEIYSDLPAKEFTEGLNPDRAVFARELQSYIDSMYGFFGYGLWAVTEKDSGKLVGRAGFANRELDGRNYLELGYIIGSESRNRGYATEACMAMLEYAADRLYADEVICLIKENNKASLRVAEKLGFRVMEGCAGAYARQGILVYYRSL